MSFISYRDSRVLNTINIKIQYNNTIKQNHLVHNTSIIRNNSPRSKNCGQQLSRASHNSLIVVLILHERILHQSYV